MFNRLSFAPVQSNLKLRGFLSWTRLQICWFHWAVNTFVSNHCLPCSTTTVGVASQAEVRKQKQDSEDDLAKADPILNAENAALCILIYNNVSLFLALR